jgi:hypothetical protein
MGSISQCVNRFYYYLYIFILQLPYSITCTLYTVNSFIFFVEHRGFPWFFVGTIKPWSSQTKDYKIGICCFSCKHVALRRKSKDRLAWNQDNVSEWEDMSICGLLFQWASTINPTKCVGLVQRGPHHDLIEDYVVLAMI